MLRRILLATYFALMPLAAFGSAPAPLKALIVTGQNNHDWKLTTPLLQKALTDTGRFTVEVIIAPPKSSDMSSFRPAFSDFSVVISNYTGDAWPTATKSAFVDYIRNGGGFVVVHSASNAFPDWPEYNAICGLGGWEGRDERWGPWIYWDKKIIRDPSPGRGGDHGPIHSFAIDVREPHHPITRGLPPRFRHAADELYNRLRGPAENLTVLATAYDHPVGAGSGRHEPILFTVTYGAGRIFHTTLGHVRGDLTAMRSVAFLATFQRGTEWAASGQVTQAVPADFPTPDEVRLR